MSKIGHDRNTWRLGRFGIGATSLSVWSLLDPRCTTHANHSSCVKPEAMMSLNCLHDLSRISCEPASKILRALH